MATASPKPIYVLHGQDDYLRQRRLRQTSARFAGDEPASLATTELDGDCALSDVLDELRTLPLLSAHRLVIVQPADRFVLDHAAALAGYLRAPAASGTLVLVVDAWPVQRAPANKDAEPPESGGRKARKDVKAAADPKVALAEFTQLAEQTGQLLDCQPPEPGRVKPWIVKAVEKRGKQIAPAAAALLVEYIGNDLARLDSEIEKLTVYVGARPAIAETDIDTVVAGTAGPKLYALSDAIGAGNVKAALEALAGLMTRRGAEFGQLALIAGRLRWSFGQGQGARLARGRRDFRLLLWADLAMKSGSNPGAIMQTLVTRLCV